MGSDVGGERAAAIYSLVETAKLNGLDPEAYLRDVLGRIADHPIYMNGSRLRKAFGCVVYRKGCSSIYDLVAA